MSGIMILKIHKKCSVLRAQFKNLKNGIFRSDPLNFVSPNTNLNVKGG